MGKIQSGGLVGRTESLELWIYRPGIKLQATVASFKKDKGEPSVPHLATIAGKLEFGDEGNGSEDLSKIGVKS